MNYPNYVHGGYIKEYLAMWDVTKAPDNHKVTLNKPELTKEEKTEMLNKYIEENEINHDEKHLYLYLYKKEVLESETDNITVEVGKTYIRDTNGFRLYTMKSIISRFNRGLFKINNLPQNPSVLFDKPNHRILKVRVNKEHIDYNLLNQEILNAYQIEVIEEVDLSPKLEYEITSLQREDDGSYKYSFILRNIYLSKTIHITFKDKINLTQEEIQNRIKQELEIMQIEYAQYQASSGSLEL